MNDRDKDMVKKLFSFLGVPEDKISFEDGEDLTHITVDIDDDIRGVFIGRYASTLDSLQFVLSLMINNEREDGVRILLDIGGYRKERMNKIIDMANSMADEVLRTGMPKSMPQLSPTERRELHLYFKENDKITTYSQGEGIYRRLFLAPMDN